METTPNYTNNNLILNSQESEEHLISKPSQRKTSFFGVFLILINTTIGSGTLLIPYCFKCGLFLVLIVSFLLSLVALWSLFILVDVSLVTKCKDYPSLFAYTFGAKREWIMHVWIILVLFGTVIIYVNWCGRLVKHFLQFIHKSPWDSEIFWNCATAIFFIFPLTIFRKLDKLQSWSGVALFFILLLLSHAIYWFAKGIIENGFDSDKIVYFRANKQLISTFSVNAMAYDCHCNIFGAANILENPTKKRLKAMIVVIVYTSFTLYNLFGIFTYLYLFDDLGPGAAIEFYPIENWFTKITIIGVIIIIIMGSPMMVWPTRNCIIDLFFAPPLRSVDHRPVSTPVWIALGAGITGLATLGACASSNIVFFFDLIGGLLTPGFVFFLPCVFYLKNVKNKKWYEILFSVLVIIVSIGATVACTYQVIKGS